MSLSMRLSEYLDAVKEWQRQRRLYESMKSLLSISGQDYSKPKVQSSPKDNMAEMIAQLLEREKRLNEAQKKVFDVFCELQEKIAEIENLDERTILEARYLGVDVWQSPAKYPEFEKIANDLSWSLPKTYKIHRNALTNYDKKYS